MLYISCSRGRTATTSHVAIYSGGSSRLSSLSGVGRNPSRALSRRLRPRSTEPGRESPVLQLSGMGDTRAGPLPGRCGCGSPYEAAARLWVTLLYM
jgi:hypothetical protein